jgi:hypothetical protein
MPRIIRIDAARRPVAPRIDFIDIGHPDRTIAADP